MPTDKKPQSEASSTPSKQTVILLISTLADTTWRLFVPTVSGLLIGLWIDSQNGTKLWFAALGTILGTLLAIALVRNQIKNIDKGN